ncbi:hypothetical protein GF1_21200 [Desulfolithobacter dissulfuricans]|uniref:Glycoside hydrolase family 20 catalytic domain-containing protein n=1 Tax=Desulfolithobacter dissulfuricans TaxID=2795293 RepID=A0A915U210_9BACT|nr:family 20 glycosylhydrolase [Desulfolithobacter dissulfuricans]BCO09744.1 hypothetical protein GF1_21200 [Desulfolithobacter dissulfuricans]
MHRAYQLFVVLVALLFAAVSSALAADDDTGSSVYRPPARIWHFVLRGVTPDRARWMVDLARSAGFEAVQVSITDGVKLDRAPWQARDDAWSKPDFFAWVTYAQENGMEVIPELELLTHQEKFFQGNFPELMFNRVTYDPRNEETYRRVLALLEELIDALHPRAIHIGHDEVAGYNVNSLKRWLGPGENMLPAELFVQDVRRIYSYLKERGIMTWMWGDMLIAPEEFPEMLDKHLHGSVPGYGKALRDKLPRDIVICDWHYFDDQAEFPSLAVMQQEGFRVIGSSWKREKTMRNFSRYAAGQGALGMMATTWFHVQRREWAVVERIIRTSGESFRRDFPD